MTMLERKALDSIQGGLELLRNAITKRAPYPELDFRVRDLLLDVRSLAEGRAKLVSSIDT